MYQITKQVPAVGKYDLVVAGGGPSGIISALAGAKMGLKTALVERFGFLGGTATGGYVLPISGFYFKGRQVVGGLPFEFVKRMEARGGARFEMPRGNVSFSPEIYKLVAEEMLTEAGVELYTNSCLTDCVCEDGRIQAVIFENKNGAEALDAEVFIDATGDGDLARSAGAEMLPLGEGECPQPLSMCFLIGGVDTDTDLLRDFIHHDGKVKRSCNPLLHERLMEELACAEFSQFGGPWFNVTLCGDVLAVNVTRTGANAQNNRELRDAERTLRRDMFAITDFWRRNYSEFADSYIIASAPFVGIRETSHIKGRYVMTGEDLLSGGRFPDTVALCAHPVDIHSAKDGTQRLKGLPAAAGVPYRAMISPDVKNLLCPSRCISAEKVAYASLRVQATLMALGQAAGIAAGLYCEEKTDVAEISLPALLDTLHAFGGITE